MIKRLGTCSICGGSVFIAEHHYMFGDSPTPTCARCGATAKGWNDTIEMENPKSPRDMLNDVKCEVRS